MNERINISVLELQAYKAIFGLDKYLGGTDIDPSSKKLIKIRALQINGCAFCIQMHTEQARKQGEAEQRIYALSAWRGGGLGSGYGGVSHGSNEPECLLYGA